MTAFFRQWEPTVMGFDPNGGSVVHYFFDARISNSPTRIVLTVAGELDFTASSQAALVIGPLTIAGRDLTVDLRRVTFMDAGGLGMLLRLRERVVSGGGAMELCGVLPQVRRVLELTGTEILLPEKERAGPRAGTSEPAVGAA
ncbi:STAS domain-containing protein [Streptomyces sp. NPDC007851]|uniref:STAS domain-containing protein n=1 Tax=Streptomyces sp. NPDC007851 TaxID=3155008 RepID=UPI00340DA77A